MKKPKKRIDGWVAKTLFKAGEKLGPENLDKLIDSMEKVEEHSSNPLQLNKDLDNYLGGYLVLISLMWIALTYYFSWQGFLSGVFLSISALVVARTIHCAIREISVHPRNVHGYNFSQKNLKKHAHLGSRLHNISRKYLMYRWYYFLYTKSEKRWSYRPYLLIILFVILLYWFPLIGFLFASVFVSAFIFVASSTSIPIAFYMGSSSSDSHILFKKIRKISGVKWVSLLHDGYSLSESPKSVEDQISMLGIMALTNVWSLRLEADKNWLAVVKDFIDFSGIIVIKADKVDAVRQELDSLAYTHYLSRVIVVGNLDSDNVVIPWPLRRCVMTEDETLEILSLAYSKPKEFRKKMTGRF